VLSFRCQLSFISALAARPCWRFLSPLEAAAAEPQPPVTPLPVRRIRRVAAAD